MSPSWVEDILSHVSNKLTKIADIWNAMGLEGDILKLRIDSLSSYLFSMLDEMHNEEVLAKQTIVDSIRTLKVKIRELESELGLTSNLSETPSLVMTEKLFYDHFKALVEKSSTILQRYNFLKEEENKLCTRLNEPSVPVTFIHVPNLEQIEILKENIDHLTVEKRSRSLRLSKLVQEITNLRDLLEHKITDDEDIYTLITAPNALENLSLSNSFLDRITRFRNSLAQEFVNLDGECQTLIQEILHIEGRLNIGSDFAVNIQQPVSAHFSHYLNQELNRLKQLQRENLPSIISKCQAELVVWWENCLVNGDARKLCLVSENQVFDEALLISLEFEIKKWKSLYVDNEPLFNAVEAWKCILSRLQISEQKMKDPSVLKNRGGVLLAIDKEIKQLRRDLSRQNSILQEFSVNYPDIKVHGLSIPDYLDYTEHQRRIEKENGNSKNPSTSVKIGSNGTKRSLDTNKSTLYTPTSKKKPCTGLLNSTSAGFSTTSKLNTMQSPFLASSSMVSLHGISPTESLSSVHTPITKVTSSVLKDPVASNISSLSSSQKKIISSTPKTRQSARLSGKKVFSTPRALQVKTMRNNNNNSFISPISTAPRSAVKSRTANNTTTSTNSRIQRTPFRA
ncbi:hypothetical protein MN116_004770 [Schistosoma mekongi]|uniref:Protein regulator of cytokinesis 1 n=1 Tax=Schistosoma mekongi TaxID=38744 RepID=A0AAE1ZCI5_SCHME|nr:hypothetical protein MN116_004770 [Schistosoma mekongi]